ncbi:hypothetical protein HaLaN_14191, partial [Haematococcus lacustris]
MALAAAPSPSLSPNVPLAAAASPSLSPSVLLSPEELQLFHGVLQRCILMLQVLPTPGFEAGQRVDYTQQQSQYKVLNSVVFSCLRVGLAPWDLIELAETKGLRLHQPSQPTPHQPTKLQALPSQALLATPHGATDQQQLQPDNQPLLQPQEQAEQELDATSQGRLISYTPPPAAAVTLPGKAVSGFTYQRHHDLTSLDRPPSLPASGSARPGAPSSADQAGLRSPGPSLTLGMAPLRACPTCSILSPVGTGKEGRGTYLVGSTAEHPSLQHLIIT